jgi:hypothetical protein
MAVRLSALSFSHHFTSRNITFLLLVLISVRGLVNPRAFVLPEELGKLIKIIHLIGPQICDLLAFSKIP